METKLNYKRTFLIGLAFLSICSFWQMYDNIIPLILQNTYHLGETMTGAVMALDNVLAIFLLWLASIIAVSCVAIRENVGDKFRTKRRVLEQVFQSEIVIDGDTTTLERLLEDYDDESVIEEGRKTLHISVPSKSIDITVDKKQGELRVNADGRKVSVKASETDDEASVTIRRETDAADSAKTARGSAARSR